MTSSLRHMMTMAVVLVSAALPVLGEDANQSFKDWTSTKGRWVHKNDIYAQVETSPDCRAFPKLTKWTDYTYELEARRTGGAEGFLIIFRASDRNNFYWWNIGGWGNSAHAIESRGGSGK
ncbi:MAG: hypothetical protein GY794_23460, partial [bacterium]|nr:hypothetical protein [bacterium]